MDDPQSWSLVVPVKAGPTAKSRMHAGAELARAIAADTLSVAARCDEVRLLVVVSSDGEWLGAVRPIARRGLALSEVAESSPGSGLLTALRDGVASARSLRPHDPAAVLLGDLPALTTGSLGAALRAAGAALRAEGAPQAFVPDAQGSGTVLLAARRPAALDPAFGAGSAAAHQARGAVRLELDLPDLRRDVDTAEDLRAAARIGLGPRTAAALDLPSRARTA